MTRALRRLRSRATKWAIEKSFRGLSRLGRLHPRANPDVHGVEVLRDVPYLPSGSDAHVMDIYRPRDRSGPLPAVLYIHGGGFHILSKETHWMMALRFARRGYVVFLINYRLAPEFPYPAAIEDSCEALIWVHRHAAEYGGDPARIVLAGESAGANLVASLAVATSWPRPEPYARAVYDTAPQVRAVIPACGILQVTNHERFEQRKKLPRLVADRISEVSKGYLKGQTTGLDMADPLVVLETAAPPPRPLPAFYTFVGTRDPLLDDTRRMHAALTRLGARSEVRYFPGELHAFHALGWRKAARELWDDSLAWLETVA
jgi:acetyl esterase